MKMGLCKWKILTLCAFGLLSHISFISGFFTTKYNKQCKDFTRKFSNCTRIPMQLQQKSGCASCHDVITEGEYTICNVTANETPSAILQLPKNTSQLFLIIINSNYHSYYTKTIKLQNISRFKSLIRLHITAWDYNYVQKYRFHLENNTFENLTELEHLAVRVSQEGNHHWQNAVKYTKKLKILDFEYSRGLGLENIMGTLKTLNSNQIEHLCLRKVQTPGGDGYNSYLNLTDLTALDISFPSLKQLVISNNGLTRIYPGLTKLAPNLTKLDASNNFLIGQYSFPFLFESLLHPQLEELLFGDQGWTDSWSEEHLGALSKEKTGDGVYAELPDNNSLVSNVVNVINDRSNHNISNVFCGTHACQNVCHIFYYFSFFRDFSCNVLIIGLDTVMPIQTLLMRKDSSCMISLPVGRKLRTIWFDSVHYEQGQTSVIFPFNGSLCVEHENQLEEISVSRNALWMQPLERSINDLRKFHNLGNLKMFRFSNNKLKMKFEEEPVIFPNLTHLDLSGNVIQLTSLNVSYCKRYPKLEILNISRNRIDQIPKPFFENCTKLRHIILKENLLTSDNLNEVNLDGLGKLTKLDISWNNFSVIKEAFQMTVQNVRTLSKHFHLDISNNRFFCNCSPGAHSSTQWIKNSQRFLIDYNHYYCRSVNGYIFIEDTRSNYNLYDCSNVMFVLEIVTIAAVLMTTFLLIFAVVKFRWRIRYMVFKLTQKCKAKSESEIAWEYDAFVSYCAEDRFWVHDVLMKTLEYHYGFKLCIHYRDFPVGGTVADTIVTCMSESREVIIVLSDMSLSSQWCQFEIDHAVRQSVDRQKNLIIIKLGNFKKPVENRTVANILDTYSYLEVCDNPKAQKLFWAKLVGSLYGDSKGKCSCSCCPYGSQSVAYDEVIDPSETDRLLS